MAKEKKMEEAKKLASQASQIKEDFIKKIQDWIEPKPEPEKQTV